MEDRILSQGAEAVIIQKENLVYKRRVEKTYRHKIIDQKLRKSRTKREKKILEQAHEMGIRVPRLYETKGDPYTIVMDYIQGERLKQFLLRGGEGNQYMEQLGHWVALLHQAGIMHGDLTTSNVMVATQGDLFLIDFGLSFSSLKIEDMAVDIHLLEQALESTHYKEKTSLFHCFLAGYASFRHSDEVLARLVTLRLRGRYQQKNKK